MSSSQTSFHTEDVPLSTPFARSRWNPGRTCLESAFWTESWLTAREAHPFGSSGKKFGISTGNHSGFTDKNNNPHLNVVLVCKCEENPGNWLILQECIAVAKHEDVHTSQTLVVVDESPPPAGATQKQTIQLLMQQVLAKAQDYVNEAAAYAVEAKYLISLGNSASDEDKPGLEAMVEATLKRMKTNLTCASSSLGKYNSLKSVLGSASGAGLDSFDQDDLDKKASNTAENVSQLDSQFTDLTNQSNSTFHGGN